MISRRQGARSSLMGQLKRLEFDTVTLVGRENELQQLRTAFSSPLHHPLVGISGYSGVGKTALVETFIHEKQEAEKDDSTWFSFGKYDQQSSSMPYSAITLALSKLVIEHEHAVASSCKANVMSEEDLALVLGIVPDLKRCFDVELLGGNDEDITNGPFRSEQLRSALVSFIRVLSKHQRIVICLDDVQWADTSSLELIESLAATEPTEEECSSLSLFMIWRTNELESAPALRKMLKRCPPLTIKVGNLAVESLNELLTHTLQRRLNDDSVMELAKVIHRKTQGNVFFFKQVLTWLQRKMLLFFSFQTYQWEWNLVDVIGDATLSDNAVAIVIEKLQDLPSPSRRAVMVASCIGSHFDKPLLLNLLNANVLDMPKQATALNEAPDFQLLEESDVICHRQGSGRFRFSHDLVQQASYSLFSSQVHREKTHFAIGQFLLQSSTVGSSLKQLLATDQLNRGAYALRDDVERFMLMSNNHKAALVAARKSAFVQAERFHRTAMKVFPRDVLWRQHYDLAITMSSKWAETLLTLGEFDEVERIVNEVLHHATSHSDTCGVLSVMMSCLSCMNRLKEASVFGYRHLRKVRKLKLSRKPGKLNAIREFLRAKRLLKKVPIEQLLLADQCNDVDYGYQFLLTRLSDNAFLTDDVEACLYFQMKLLNMAFVQGPSSCTAIGLTNYAIFLGATGDLDGAYEVSTWVLAMANRFKSRTFDFRVFMPTYCFLSHLRRPQQELLDLLLECHRSAMRVGEMMHACNCMQSYFLMYFFCGLHLMPLVRDVRRYRAIFLEQNECSSIRCLVDINGQAALNLTGQSDDPFVLDGEFFQRDSFMDTIVNARHGIGWLAYWGWYLHLSYILDPSSAHVQRAFTNLYRKRGRTSMVDSTTTFCATPICMMSCLAAIALERVTGHRIFTRKRRFLTKVVKRFVTNGVPGVSHRLFLIEAETLTLNAKSATVVVKSAFDKAISTSRRTGFVQDCAIANERCGNYFLRLNDVEWAEYYLTRAMESYSEWGASEKVKMMKTQYSILGEKSHDLASKRSFAIQSRERFKADVVDMHCAEVAQILFDPHDSGSDSNSSDITGRYS